MEQTYVTTYEVNERTLALYPNRDPEYQTKVIETEGVYFVKDSPLRIVEQSCTVNGATYDGRKGWAAHVTKYKYKLPILIQEYGGIIASPTHSPEHLDCVWILIAHVVDIYPERIRSGQAGTIILFQNGMKLTLPLSFADFRSQLLTSRACLGYFQARSFFYQRRTLH